MKIFGFHPEGCQGRLVEVEVDIQRGLPAIEISGLASASVREARDRIRVALRRTGFVFPADRILINLSPAGLSKTGTAYDLALAFAILMASGQLHEWESLGISRILCMGELGFSGDVRPVRAVLSGLIVAQSAGIDAALVASANAVEANEARLSRVFTLQSLTDIHDVRALHVSVASDMTETRFGSSIRLPEWNGQAFPDLSGFDGMHHCDDWKLALCVAALGGHHVLAFGPPGQGKTMGVKLLPAVMPDLEAETSLEVTRIHSTAGVLAEGEGLVRRPPFRMPHHTASAEAILGGGPGLRPGELSLAHGGVLVLDEAPEFSPRVLQGLREPLEEARVRIGRAHGLVNYPAGGLLALTMNPCPCGNMGKSGSYCLCQYTDIRRYWSRLGGALLDRIAIRIALYSQTASASRLLGFDTNAATLSSILYKAYTRRRQRRLLLQENENALNSMDEWKRQSGEDERTCRMVFANAVPRLSLRSLENLVRLSRTIADLFDRERVQELDCKIAMLLHDPSASMEGLPPLF